MQSRQLPPDKHRQENQDQVPRQVSRGNLQFAMGIIPATRTELGNLPLNLRRVIHRGIYAHGGVDIKRARRLGEQFYAKYFRSAICRNVQDWVRLEESGIDLFADKQSLKSVANALTARLDIGRNGHTLRVSGERIGGQPR